MTRTVRQYGIKWLDDAMNERIAWIVQDPDFPIHKDILSDEVLAAEAVGKVTRLVTYTDWEPVEGH